MQNVYIISAKLATVAMEEADAAVRTVAGPKRSSATPARNASSLDMNAATSASLSNFTVLWSGVATAGNGRGLCSVCKTRHQTQSRCQLSARKCRPFCRPWSPVYHRFRLLTPHIVPGMWLICGNLIETAETGGSPYKQSGHSSRCWCMLTRSVFSRAAVVMLCIMLYWRYRLRSKAKMAANAMINLPETVAFVCEKPVTTVADGVERRLRLGIVGMSNNPGTSCVYAVEPHWKLCVFAMRVQSGRVSKCRSMSTVLAMTSCRSTPCTLVN